MIRNLKETINIPMAYVDEFLARADELDDEQKKEIRVFAFQQDQNLGSEEMPKFRKRITQSLYEQIMQCSFYDNATNGHSEVNIWRFKQTLVDELKYRLNGGVPLHSEFVHEMYQKAEELYPGTHQRMFFIMESGIPNRDTDFSIEAELRRNDEVGGLDIPVVKAFQQSEFHEKLKSKVDTYTLTMIGRRLTDLTDMIVNDICKQVAKLKPPTRIER